MTLKLYLKVKTIADVNSAAVMLTKDTATGESAFDPSVSGGKKELRGVAFCVIEKKEDSTSQIILSANRVRGILVFLKEILPYFSL